MDFLGIGPLELILILVVILIVVGPARLPEIAGAIGRGIRKFREATTELSKDFREMAEEAKDAEKEASAALEPDTELTRDLKKMAGEIKDVTREASTALEPTPEEKVDTQKEEGKI
jgi:TatA/E family protein of Tat protein translocase